MKKREIHKRTKLFVLLLAVMTASVMLCCGCDLRFGGADSGGASAAVSSEASVTVSSRTTAAVRSEATDEISSEVTDATSSEVTDEISSEVTDEISSEATDEISSALVGRLADGVMEPSIHWGYAASKILARAKEFGEAYRDSEAEFSFQLLDEENFNYYDSREEILQEQCELTQCYQAYLSGKASNDPRVRAAGKLKDKLYNRLEALWKKKYPLTKQEKKQIKVNRFYEEIYTRTVAWRETRRAWKDAMSREETDERSYFRAGDRYTEILKLQKQYEAGELSIDRALKQVAPDFQLDPWYLYDDTLMKHLGR